MFPGIQGCSKWFEARLQRFQRDFRGVPDDIRNVLGIFERFQGLSDFSGIRGGFRAVLGNIRGGPDDFRGASENFWNFQGDFGALSWISGALEGITRGFRHILGGFRAFQGCSVSINSFQGSLRRVKNISEGFKCFRNIVSEGSWKFQERFFGILGMLLLSFLRNPLNFSKKP